MTDTPLLSILMPVVPGRPTETLDGLLDQAQGEPVEVLWLGDNRMRSIGLKRDALMQASRGAYVAFVDDDDAVSPHYVKTILGFLGESPDAVLFDFEVREVGGTRKDRLVCSLEYPDDDIRFDGRPVLRNLWHTHAIRGEIARAHRFPDMQWGEDYEWLKGVRAQVKTAVKAQSVLYFYAWRPE